MNTLLVLIVGVFLRLIAPLTVTVLIVYALHKLDMRWQAEAEREHQTLVKDDVPCWKEWGISRDDVKFYGEQSGQPCWQTHRLKNGYLRESCLDCDVFLNAPIPTSKYSHTHL